MLRRRRRRRVLLAERPSGSARQWRRRSRVCSLLIGVLIGMLIGVLIAAPSVKVEGLAAADPPLLHDRFLLLDLRSRRVRACTLGVCEHAL